MRRRTVYAVGAGALPAGGVWCASLTAKPLALNHQDPGAEPGRIIRATCYFGVKLRIFNPATLGSNPRWPIAGDDMARRKQNNPVVVALAKRRPKAGRHKDRKKESSKRACRGPKPRRPYTA